MSGPKTGGYTLTPEQLRRIQEEVERQLKIMASRGRLNSRIDKVRTTVSEIDNMVSTMQRFSGINEEVRKLQQLRNDAMNVIGSISLSGDSEDIALMDEQAEKLRPIYDNLIKKIGEVSEISNQVKEEIKKKQDSVLKNAGRLSFAGVGRKIEVEENPNLAKAIQELENIDSTHLPKKLIAKIEQVRNSIKENVDFIDNYYSMSVRPLVKECNAYNSMYAANYEKYEILKAQYEMVSAELGVAAEPVEFTEVAISILEKKIEELKNASVKRNEQEYISQCIDEAMHEMGYNVIGNREVTKKNGRKLRHELFLFDEGTAVDVTYAGNGQISMELGGLDNEDRAPSNAESVALVDSMVTFCDAYAELERRLKEKGVITTKISVLPPDEEYAQIINMEDYSMTEKVATFDVSTSKKQQREHTALRKEL
ncbi:MAG: hypothetical protein MJ110_04605 [Lachnospiraceae bacterium]|nr:hypothetical protein [Lachnospiraceae bacterium]